MHYEHIDVLKGIGIILVVLGHLIGGFGFDMIFLFHMPLFFFISGFLFKKQPLKKYLSKKTIALIVPYFTFLTILYPCYYHLEESDNILKYFGKAFIGGNFLNKGLIAFWFITCLFLTQQLFNLLATKIKSEKTIGFIILICFLISYINSEFYDSFWLPWNANVVFAAIPFFYFGYIAKNDKLKTPSYLLIISFITILALIYFIPNLSYDMKSSNYGIPFISFFMSLVIIFFLMYVSKNLIKMTFVSKYLKYLGDRSLVIMFLHQPIIIFLNQYFSTHLIIKLIMSIVVSCICYFLFNRFSISRILFLGSTRDFYNLKND